MNTPTTGASNPNANLRTELVDSARKQWIGKLIDLSRRNNLYYFRVLKTGTLDLSGAPTEQMSGLLSGKTVPVSKLIPVDREVAAATVREIARRALGNAEEKGLQTLFVAVGTATWPAEDGGRPPEAPVLLVPVTVTTHGRSTESFSLTRGGSVQVNLVLLHVLESQFGVRIAAEDLIPLLLGDDEGEVFDPQPLYNELTSRVADKIRGFEIRPTAFLGNFAFQKMAMVKDLQERGAELAAHDLVAAIAGDKDARSIAGASETNIEPNELDRVPPDNEFLVLDADSSQQSAIASILVGQNAVIHGPPGTGKSQTIVNLVASLAAIGKRVLFVAEKRAALEVVKRRLKDVGLDHLAIDLHGADVAPKRVMEQIAQALEKVRTSTPVDCAEIHKRVTDRRSRLNGHVARTHVPRAPAQKSIYELQGLLLLLGRKNQARTRWRGADLAHLTPERIEKARDLLKEAAGFPGLFLRSDSSPWTGAHLSDGGAVQAALELVRRMHDTSLTTFVAAATALSAAVSAPALMALKELRTTLRLIDDVQQSFAMYSDDLYRHDLPQLVAQLTPGAAGGIRLWWAWLTNGSFRRARETAIRLRKGAKAPIGILHREFAAAADQHARWKRQNFSGVPARIENYGQLKQTVTSFWADYDKLANVVARKLDDCAMDELVNVVSMLAADSTTPRIIPKLTVIEAELDAIGIGALVSELRTSQPPVENWVSMLNQAWYSSTLDATFEQEPELGGFSGKTHNGFVSEFADLDEERIDLAAARVRRAHAERAVAAMNAHVDQQMLLRAEAQKSRRHLPLRKLFAQASEVLTAVCPCWMASPLSVSQLLDGGKKYFDFVIFDEASQVLPEDAVCAILRGQKLVVAGDRNQLPPTTFFAAATDDELAAQEEADASEGYESLLDMMNGFLPSKYLSWHYRSRDEALIAFSNHFIYGDRLVTFPGPGGPSVISHALVNQQLGADGQEESCSAEVQRTVDLVLEHARKRRNDTLGVITMGIRHRDRIQRALDNALQNCPELDEFFDESRSERFFVKNLEAVQGDERDAIIISIGYGNDRAGNLPFRFGPLLPEGGRRRLNVAVSRARKRLTLVSSFSHLDMDMGRVRAGSGVELLRQYLEYASSNGKLLGTSYLTSVPPDDFEQDVYDALTSRGLKLIPQLGASRFRIDLVVEHPKKPGRYILAIECDGATYHSSNTARDRDRLRQRQLEALGWRFHRIWSTDWFMRKADEVERALQAFLSAVEYADRLDSTDPHSDSTSHYEKNDDAAKATLQPQPNGRSMKPFVMPGLPITAYTHWQLVEIVQWVASDGLMRTDDELLHEAVEVLGFRRRGTRIDTALTRAIQEWRRAAPKC
jgi:very-short-patch-repair endonuclease